MKIQVELMIFRANRLLDFLIVNGSLSFRFDLSAIHAIIVYQLCKPLQHRTQTLLKEPSVGTLVVAASSGHLMISDIPSLSIIISTMNSGYLLVKTICTCPLPNPLPLRARVLLMYHPSTTCRY